MYAPSIIQQKLSLIQSTIDKRPKSQQYSLKIYSISEVDFYNRHLYSLVEGKYQPGNPKSWKWIRPLKQDEINFIENERYICSNYFLYYATRYAFIQSTLTSESEIISRFNPNLAQKIIVDIWGESEANFWAIMMFHIKARQLGVTTLKELAIAHRNQFLSNLNSLVASNDPDKTRKMAAKMKFCWDMQPCWMIGEYKITNSKEQWATFPEQNNVIVAQHGTAKSGMARSDTPNIFHISEMSDFLDPEEDIEASLLNAVHEHPTTFGTLETTSKASNRKASKWVKDKWKFCIQNYHKGKSRIRPVFLPYFVGEDVWPTKTWCRQFLPKNPEKYKFKPLTLEHIRNCQQYTQNTSYLRKHLGRNWKLSFQQAYWWEFTRDEAEQRDKLYKFYEELCIGGDCKVSTNLGFVNIRDSKDCHKTEKGWIQNYIPKGVKETFKLKTTLGRELIATEDHLLYSELRKDWIQLKDLFTGESIKLSPPMFADDYYIVKWSLNPICETAIKVDEDFGRFLGYFMGDGSFSNNCLSIACDIKDQDVVQDVCSLIQKLFGFKPHTKNINGMTLVRVSNIRWKEILYNLGCIDYKETDNEKNQGMKRKVSVPECIWRSPKSVIKSFLSALFECDGHAYKNSPKVGFFSKYETFCRDLQLLLLGFGLNFQIRVNNKTNAQEYTYEGRQLEIGAAGANLFYNSIGFIGNRKQSTGKRRELEKLGRIPNNNEMVDHVEIIESNGLSDVYDLTIEKTHCFGANGILVHNCATPEEAFQKVGRSPFKPEQLEFLRLHAKPLANYYGKPAVFGIVGDGIELEHEPTMDEIDSTRPMITINCDWDSNNKRKYRLIPLNHDTELWENRLFIYEFPFSNKQFSFEYGLGVDGGGGVYLNNSVIEVVKKGTLTYPSEQVAEFTSPNLTSPELTPFCLAIGTYFSLNTSNYVNQAKQVVEINFGGYELQRQLQQACWSQFHVWKGAYDHIGKTLSRSIGWETTSRTRAMLMTSVISQIKGGFFKVNSPFFIEELGNLQKTEDSEKIESKGSDTDDRFIAGGIAFFSLHDQELFLMGSGDVEIMQMFKSHYNNVKEEFIPQLTLAEAIDQTEEIDLQGSVEGYIMSGLLPTINNNEDEALENQNIRYRRLLGF